MALGDISILVYYYFISESVVFLRFVCLFCFVFFFFFRNQVFTFFNLEKKINLKIKWIFLICRMPEWYNTNTYLKKACMTIYNRIIFRRAQRNALELMLGDVLNFNLTRKRCTKIHMSLATEIALLFFLFFSLNGFLNSKELWWCNATARRKEWGSDKREYFAQPRAALRIQFTMLCLVLFFSYIIFFSLRFRTFPEKKDMYNIYLPTFIESIKRISTHKLNFNRI